ncbi:tyrosine-protein phosphatase non-receptor type substrate 1-like isoform X2 [Haemorhous mexicanus]|uniref:tyrosine-protein phosphatase non-receptor type substrate 1-like isoform X2 n=1 Tax=Haemorhous mexicanus TaxID=30427 RepID=UPI0028BF4F40|nr:tyrosine-protein phosphatase non-receptor type substrate 1-like isoform X2 [Haemorhous mexicanus]
MPAGGDARLLCRLSPAPGRHQSVNHPLASVSCPASPFPSQSLGRTHGRGSSSAPVRAARPRPAAALGCGCPGPVMWLKGWGSGNKTVYDQNNEDPSYRVTRAVPGSDTDFTIHIRNFQPDDVGTYYCVKFVKGNTGEDEVFRHGGGTVVSVQEAALVPGVVAAAVVLCFLLLLGLFVALCMYRRKRQGGVGSPCPARTVAVGSFSSVPLRCCAGTPGTPSEVLDAESSHPPSQSSKEENNIHYADLQPLPLVPQRGRSLGTAPTEYASLRVAAK